MSLKHSIKIGHSTDRISINNYVRTVGGAYLILSMLILSIKL